MLDETTTAAIAKICKNHGPITKEWVLKNGKCRYCKLDSWKRYYDKKSLDPAWIAKQQEKERERWARTKEQRTKRRQTPEAKAKRQAAYLARIEHYRATSKTKQKKYRDELHDHYVVKRINESVKLGKKAEIPESMIELQRSILKLKRMMKDKTTDKLGKRLIDNGD